MLGKKGVAKFGPDSAAIEGESKRVSLHQWSTLLQNSFKVGQVCQGECKFQLLLLIPVTFSDGESKRLKIFVDMGAEVNLNKTGLVPSHLTYLAKTLSPWLRLMGENTRWGQVL